MCRALGTKSPEEIGVAGRIRVAMSKIGASVRSSVKSLRSDMRGTWNLLTAQSGPFLYGERNRATVWQKSGHACGPARGTAKM
jgi:hypothetical protein